MKLPALIPPLGWLTALASAAATGLWLQVAQDLDVTGSSEAGGPIQTAVNDTAALRLPPPSDAIEAARLFASRPLLAEGRRAFSPAPVAELPAPEPVLPAQEPDATLEPDLEPPPIAMLGTVEGRSARRVLLRDQQAGTETWYSAGDTVLGWTIVEILPDRTRLQLQDAEITFNLFGE